MGDLKSKVSEPEVTAKFGYHANDYFIVLDQYRVNFTLETSITNTSLEDKLT